MTLAVGGEKYYVLARNLLYSYRYHNPDSQPFAIICDRENVFTSEFEDVVIIDNPSFSFLDKLRLVDLAPYDETIFIDADCLALRNLDELWDIVKDSPDFGIFGTIWAEDSEIGKIEFARGGSLRDRMHFACTCQGGMYYIRKSSALIPFQELSFYILDHFDEFHKEGDPNPSDDNIYPLACSVFDFRPVKDWYEIFCFAPESDIVVLDLLGGEIRYKWRFCDKVLEDSCFFVHFGMKHTDKWLYRREAYLLSCYVDGRSPATVSLFFIWLSGWMQESKRLIKKLLRQIIPLRIKAVVFRLFHNSQTSY